MYKDIDELIELFDLEHQRTLLELAQEHSTDAPDAL
jgi:hypothetical protein